MQDEPGERHRLHPGAAEGDELTGDEQPEVSVPEGAEGTGGRGGGRVGGGHEGRISGMGDEMVRLDRLDMADRADRVEMVATAARVARVAWVVRQDLGCHPEETAPAGNVVLEEGQTMTQDDIDGFAQFGSPCEVCMYWWNENITAELPEVE